MAELVADLVHRHLSLDELHRVGVAQPVEVDALLDPGALRWGRTHFSIPARFAARSSAKRT